MVRARLALALVLAHANEGYTIPWTNAVTRTNAATAGCQASKSQGGEEGIVFNTFFRNKKAGTYVEIGGYDGVTFSNTLMLHTCHRWNGLLVEASPANFALMKQNVARLRPTASIAHGGVCPTAGNLTFEAFDDCTACSGAADAVKAYNANSNKSKKPSSVHIVPCKPFTAYLAAAGIQHVDFFSLDVEGHELKVIESINFDTVTIDSFLVELNGLHPSKDATLRTHLRQHGFKECVGLMSRNSVFIRLNGPLKCPQHTAWWQIELEELIEVTMKSLGGGKV